MDADARDEVRAPEGWEVTAIPMPRYDEEAAERFLGLCRQDLCGCYGRSWSCPPGWTERMDSLGARFSEAALLERTYGIDPGDREAVAAASEDMHRALRAVTADLRSRGIPALGLADGRCGYCGVCAYPEPCRFPEQLVPSISAAGIDIGEVLRGIGRPFAFREDGVTLCGIVLHGDARAHKD